MPTQVKSYELSPIFIQAGYGIPDHFSTIGSEYTDLYTALKYVNKNGLDYWLELGGGSGGGSFSGGTVSGSTIFTGGLSATTFSATTYLNLPIDAIPTNGSANSVSSNGVFDALALKQDDFGFTPYKYIYSTPIVHTGTLTETILLEVGIPVNTFNTMGPDDIVKMIVKYTKSTASSTAITRVRVNTTSGSLVGAVGIARLDLIASVSYGKMCRDFNTDGINITGLNENLSAVSDSITVNSIQTSAPFDTTNTIYILFTVQLGSTIDVVRLNMVSITN